MRNWNCIGIMKVTNKRKFSSYLWGIETGVCLLSLGSRNNGFHLTYEELKQIETIQVSEEVDCFHLTYEELKLSIQEHDDVRVLFVFILPMRNWNIFRIFINDIIFIMFSSYLWGIETGDSGKCISKRFLYVFILPMRNWNSSCKAPTKFCA